MHASITTRFFFGALPGVLLLLGSCVKDKGNYTYKTLNQINITGIDSAYYINYYEDFTLTPTLTFTQDQPGDTARYTYQWVLDHLVGYQSPASVISNSRVLNIPSRSLIPILLSSGGGIFGAFSSYLRVTDTKTGLFQDAYFTLKIGGPTYEGWMLLCDPGNGMSRLDMVPAIGPDSLYRDILKTVGSTFPVNAKPSFICSETINLGPPTIGTDAVFIGTAKNAAILGLDTLEYQPTYDLSYFINGVAPSNYSNALFYSKGVWGKVLFYANGDVYSGQYRINKVNYLDGGGTPFKSSPFIAVSDNLNGDYNDILFDEDTKTFVRLPYYDQQTCISLPPGTLFDFATGQELKYMQYAFYNGGEAFAILGTGTNLNLARFSPTGEQHYYAPITDTTMTHAEHFAVSDNQGYVFFSVGGKVYEYDLTVGKSFLMKDYGTKNVSLMKFQHFANADIGTLNSDKYTLLQQKLAICTYDPSDLAGSGTFELYTVPDINAPIQLYQSYSGTGKVVSLSYKEQ